MAFKFKKQVLGFMDLLRFKKMVPKRREKLKSGSSKPLPVTYRVNETAKILHPGYRTATLAEIKSAKAKFPARMRSLLRLRRH